jgi:transposase-like protein
MSRRHHTDTEKARIIREFHYHHGSNADFYCQRGISSQTFANWRRRSQVSLASKPAAPEFLEFEFGATPERRRSASLPSSAYRTSPKHPDRRTRYPTASHLGRRQPRDQVRKRKSRLKPTTLSNFGRESPTIQTADARVLAVIATIFLTKP